MVVLLQETVKAGVNSGVWQWLRLLRIVPAWVSSGTRSLQPSNAQSARRNDVFAASVPGDRFLRLGEVVKPLLRRERPPRRRTTRPGPL